MDKIRKKAMGNHHLTVIELAEDVGILIDSVDAVLSVILNLKCLSAKLVSKPLNFL